MRLSAELASCCAGKEERVSGSAHGGRACGCPRSWPRAARKRRKGCQGLRAAAAHAAVRGAGL
eukprot:177395-Chlamydomonas_euryale.AAC.1